MKMRLHELKQVIRQIIREWNAQPAKNPNPSCPECRGTGLYQGFSGDETCSLCGKNDSPKSGFISKESLSAKEFYEQRPSIAAQFQKFLDDEGAPWGIDSFYYEFDVDKEGDVVARNLPDDIAGISHGEKAAQYDGNQWNWSHD
jgi:hypothetical protein